MAVPVTPVEIVFFTDAGSPPYFHSLSVKFAGGGWRPAATAPSPLPLAPWQGTQLASNTFIPRFSGLAGASWPAARAAPSAIYTPTKSGIKIPLRIALRCLREPTENAARDISRRRSTERRS